MSHAFREAVMSQIFYGAQTLCNQLAYFTTFFMEKVGSGIYTPLGISTRSSRKSKGYATLNPF